jgi:hypothetical protein
MNHRRVREESATASAVIPVQEIYSAMFPNLTRADERLLPLPQ